MYTLYMALHITNPVVEDRVRELAAVTGETITEAIGAAVEERLRRLEPGAARGVPATGEEILELVRSFRLQPTGDDRSEEEILGYGPDGYCV